MKTLVIASFAMFLSILSSWAGDPIDGIYGVVITNFECQGSLGDFLKKFHEAWQKAANGIEVPEFVVNDPSYIKASSSLSDRVAGLTYHCGKPMQAKDILDQAMSAIGLHYVIVHPKTIQVYQDWDSGGQVETRVFPVTVKGAKLIGFSETVGNAQLTQGRLAAYGIAPRWFEGVAQAVYEPSKGGLIISHSNGGVFIEAGQLIWLADHGLILPSIGNNSVMTNATPPTNAVQSEKNHSVTVLCNSAKSEKMITESQ